MMVNRRILASVPNLMTVPLEELETVLNKIPDAKHGDRVYAAAKIYARAGLRVLPATQGKGLPPKKYGITYESATTDLETIECWFAPGGTFYGENISLATGGVNGVDVLDVDRHPKGDDGLETLKLLENEHGKLPITPVQQTPNGGLHYLFSSVPGFGSKTEVAPGIDTRGGGFDSNDKPKRAGHILVYPSKVGNKEYSWLKGGEIAITPQWLIQKVVSPAIRKSRADGPRGTGRGNDTAPEDEEEIVPLEQVERIQNTVHPDNLSYDEWLQWGMALKTQHPIEGLDVWDKWSQRGSRYKHGECVKRWDGFDVTGTVRMASLLWIADQYGYIPQNGDKTLNPCTRAKIEINKKYPAVTLGNKVRMVRVAENGDLNALSFGDLKFIYENQLVEVIDGDSSKWVNPVELWKRWKHRKLFDGMGLYPPPAVCPANYRNLWHGFAVEPQEGDVQPFIDFVTDVICNGNKEYTTWLLDWFAQMFQEPGKKPGTAIVLRGGEGIGKNSLTGAISKLFQRQNYSHMVDADHFVSEFNNHLLQSVFIVLNEAVWSGNHKEANKLKGLITEDDITVQLKGVDKFNAFNCARVVIMTNEKWAVPAGHGSRRYFALKVPDNKKGDSNYWESYHKWVAGHLPQLLHWMLNRKITSNLREAPVTDELKLQRELTATRELTPADEVALYLVTHGIAESAPQGSKLDGMFIWTNDLIKRIALHLGYKSVSQQLPRQVAAVFSEHGYELRADRTKVTGRLFVLPKEPTPLVACLVLKLNVPAEELVVNDDWSEKHGPLHWEEPK